MVSRKALVRRPGPRLPEGIVDHIERVPVDYDLAVEQWEQYVAVLRRYEHLEAIPDDAKAKFARRRVPLRRYGRPEEVAQMTLNLCLPASSFVNGAVIPVDGGMSIRHT